jgi:hypothetical protein
MFQTLTIASSLERLAAQSITDARTKARRRRDLRFSMPSEACDPDVAGMSPGIRRAERD